MELKLYDTLTKEKRVFTPLDPKRVRMYVCGPTVYDFAHIGNARPVIVFDVLYRLLRHLYGETHVKYVRNITDVDDKINARAAERGVSIRELTEETYKNFKTDVAALGCLAPDVEPRATEHIEEMRILIEKLVASKHAYVAEEHVLFSVPSMKDYGQLSKRPLDEMIAGARVDVAPYKRDPMDFVLWKPSKEGEPAWPSPSGIKTPGRPGWHIECSAMSWKHLGETFDIHGGGIDLVFPHHENEIAQSRCAFHTGVMANYWMHNGFLQVEGEKMAKSTGNFVTIRELFRGQMGAPVSGAVARLAMLRTHYRQPIDWTARSISEAKEELGEWALIISSVAKLDYKSIAPSPNKELLSALCDDLNTAEALAVLREQFNRIMRQEIDVAREFVGNLLFLGIIDTAKLHAYIRGIGSVGAVSIRKMMDSVSLGEALKVAFLNNDDFLRKETEEKLAARNLRAELSSGRVTLSAIDESLEADDDQIEEMIAARNEARKAKNFAESDRIRDELAAMGVVLKDSKDGTTWEIAR